MHTVDIYYSSIEKWNMEVTKSHLVSEDLAEFSSIISPLTLCQKIVSRLLTRILLSRYCEIKPDELKIGRTSKSKPFLIDFPHIQFNISHSNQMVLLGVSLHHSIGIDIEFIDNLKIDEDLIAKDILTEGEYHQYQTSKIKSPYAFYEFWTIKEAIIKAYGKGLWEINSIPEFTLSSESKFILKKDNTQMENWSILPLHLDSSYKACVVVNHPNVCLRIKFIEPNQILSTFLGVKYESFSPC